MKMLKPFKWALAATFVAGALLGCGGGGGDAGCSRFTGCTDGSTTTEQSVSQLRMTLSSANVSNGSLGEVVATVTALDSSNKSVAGATVEYSVADASAVSEDAGAFVGAVSATTNVSGQSTAQLNLGTDKSNRVVTVIATSGNVTVSKTINIRGSAIVVSTGTTLVDAGAQETITFTVQDSNRGGQGGVPITVQADGLGTRSGSTDDSGAFVYAYTVPNSPGSSLVFTVNAAGVSTQYNVQIKAAAQQLPAPVLTNGVTSALQVNPNVIAVNASGSTANKMQVVASFVDNSGNPIPNVRVAFRLDGVTANAVGGQFSNGPITGTPVLYSGADGKVQIFYIPGTSSSPNNAISVKACWGSTDAQALNCTAQADSKPITIADEAVSVTIGTDGLLITEAASLQYSQQYVIKVVNSAGQPKEGLTVSAQINTIEYYKGTYVIDGDQWVLTSANRISCAKEDLDDDDRIDVNGSTSEDLDGDGRLEPIRADVSLTAVNGWTTNADGVVIIKMSYPQNIASWMKVNIMATALVGGSEGRASRQQVLAVPAAAINNVDADPPFKRSDYGVVVDGASPCSNPN